MNILVGKGWSTKPLKYAGVGMVEKDVELAEFVDKIFWDILDRIKYNPLILFSPEFFLKQITEADRRFFKNCETLRGCIKEAIRERQETKGDPDEDIDMVSMLAHDDLYSKNIDDIVDDVLIMFIAGSKTIQTTTTNFITHMLHRPDIKAKLDAELNPFLDKCKDNFMELMTTELVEELDYLKMCYSEVLRYDTPIPTSSTSCFSKDVTVGGVHFKKGSPIIVAMAEMHRNVNEWIDPDTFNPDRFDSNSPLSKRPDGGKRNPLSFNPFLGGKRICLGKTFAEITLRLTLPLYYHHFDFEFVKEEQKKERPHYEIGGSSQIDIPINFITKNKVIQNFKQFEVKLQKAVSTKQGDNEDIPEDFEADDAEFDEEVKDDGTHIQNEPEVQDQKKKLNIKKVIADEDE